MAQSYNAKREHILQTCGCEEAAPSSHHVESLVNLPGRGLLSKLCEELSGQSSWPMGFHAKMIPSVQSIVQETNNLVHYHIRLSHLEWGQKRRQIKTLCRQTQLFIQWTNHNYPVSQRQLHSYQLQRALVCFQGDEQSKTILKPWPSCEQNHFLKLTPSDTQ